MAKSQVPSSPVVGTPVERRHIWIRKLDLFYVICVSLLLALDIIPLARFLLPSWATAFRNYYIAENNDPLYQRDPLFFQLFMWLEVFVTVPAGVWIVRSLIRDYNDAPVFLLVWAFHFCASSLVCLVELLGTKNWPPKDITKNAPDYLLFLAIRIFLGGVLISLGSELCWQKERPFELEWDSDLTDSDLEVELQEHSEVEVELQEHCRRE